MIIRKLFITATALVVAACSLANTAPVRLWLPVIPNKVPDRFVAARQEALTGLLHERIMINEDKRLLQVDSAVLLGGFLKRPGSQHWIAEHIGKFLYAGARSYRYTHDEQLKKLMDAMVPRYISTQLPDGYLGTYLPKDYWSQWDVWAHKYAIIGLLSYYSITGDEASMDAARKAADLICRTFGTGPGQLDLNKSGHHAGMAAGSILEPMIELYRYTGERRYLAFAEYILSNWESATGPHIISTLEKTKQVLGVGNNKTYEMMSCFLGILNYYQLTGETRYLDAMMAGWKDIVANRMYITGAVSSKEFFQPDHVLPAETADRMGEGCVTTTWIQFNDQLLRITGDLQFAGEIERAVYNHLFAAENTQTGCVSYYTALQATKPHSCKITCCLSSVPRGIALIPELVWGTIDNRFTVMLYEPGEVTDSLRAADGSMVQMALIARTDFPATGDISYTVRSDKARKLALRFRVPAWSANYRLTVNGKAVPAAKNGVIEVERVWKPTDNIRVHFDMPVRVLAGGLSYPGQVAFQRGPQVLAIDSLLNPGYTANAALSLPVGTAVSVEDVRNKLPVGWIGRQAYRLAASKGQPATGPVLVPFADAGQFNNLQQVWLSAK